MAAQRVPVRQLADDVAVRGVVAAQEALDVHQAVQRVVIAHVLRRATRHIAHAAQAAAQRQQVPRIERRRTRHGRHARRSGHAARGECGRPAWPARITPVRRMEEVPEPLPPPPPGEEACEAPPQAEAAAEAPAEQPLAVAVEATPAFFSPPRAGAGLPPQLLIAGGVALMLGAVRALLRRRKATSARPADFGALMCRLDLPPAASPAPPAAPLPLAGLRFGIKDMCVAPRVAARFRCPAV